MVGVLVALLLGAMPGVALACSGPPFDPKEAAVIPEGWVERVALRPDLQASPGPVPVAVTLRVERTLRGTAGDRVTFIDYGSAYLLPDGTVRFAGGAGACGILNADPTGQYALVVLDRDRDGQLRAHILQGAAFGDGPDAPPVAQLRQRLVGQLTPSLPNTGGGATTQWPPLAGTLLALSILGLLGAGASARVRKSGDSPCDSRNRPAD